MLKLHGMTTKRWDAEPFVARLTDNNRLPTPLRITEALIVHASTTDRSSSEGFLCLFERGDQALETSYQMPSNQPVVRLPDDLSYLSAGDIVKVVYEASITLSGGDNYKSCPPQ